MGEARGEVQPWNTENAASDIIRARFKGQGSYATRPLVQSFRSWFLVDAADVAVAPEAAAAAVAKDEIPGESKDRY